MTHHQFSSPVVSPAYSASPSPSPSLSSSATLPVVPTHAQTEYNVASSAKEYPWAQKFSANIPKVATNFLSFLLLFFRFTWHDFFFLSSHFADFLHSTD
jgi:hypothetical protein